jgi:two-component system sensor histidine kinase AgrC
MTVIGKYHTSLDTLQAQESIISDYRILNHENKNNLMTIKSLSKSKKVNKYIDSLLNQQEKLKNKIIDETLKLPEGGIRGLIYNKLTLIKEYNIPYYLNVDKKINYKSLSNISDEDIVDVCQILGVFIDNAIDESNLIDDKQINIDLHLNNNEFIISIANHYNKKLNINNLKTTKGKGHGYGLKLVKKIIESNNKIHTKKEINKDLFIQKIYIKR